MKTKLLIALTLLLTSQQFAMAYNLNGKKLASDRITMLLPSDFNNDLMRTRMKIIAKQFTNNTNVKVKLRYHDINFDSLLDAVNFVSTHNLILVLYKPGLTYGLSETKLANASFTTSNGGTLVHAGLIRINDLRYQERIEHLESQPNYALNYLTNTTWHEVGHLAGLDHINERSSIMFGSGKFSKLRNLGFSTDDKRGLRDVYNQDKK